MRSAYAETSTSGHVTAVISDGDIGVAARRSSVIDKMNGEIAHERPPPPPTG